MVLISVTLKVSTSIVSISRRGGEEEIRFLRREGTYLKGRCGSSTSETDTSNTVPLTVSVFLSFPPCYSLIRDQVRSVDPDQGQE